MGTAGYMSPEQVRGEKLDARTDLFSFGLVLYEMTTGQRAFSGETAAVVHDAILNNSPVPARELNSTLPSKLATTIDKALEKDRKQRYQSAAEMGADLRRAQPGAVREVPKAKVLRTMSLVVAVVALCGAGLFFVRSRWRIQEPAKEPLVRQLTPSALDSPALEGVAISPDGRHVAYLDGTRGVFVLQIDSGEGRSFATDTAFRRVSWSLDGDHLFLSKAGETGIWKASILDGTIEKVQTETLLPVASPHGKYVAYLKGEYEIWVADADGRAARRLLSESENLAPHRLPSEGETLLEHIAWAPDSNRIAYETYRELRRDEPKKSASPLELKLKSCDLNGQCSTILSDPRLWANQPTSLIWLADGRLIFSFAEPPPNENTTNLWSLRVDPDTGKALGKPKRLTSWTGFQQLHLAASSDGKRLVFQQLHAESTVKLLPLRAKQQSFGMAPPLSAVTWAGRAEGWTDDSQSVLFTAIRYGKRGIFAQKLNENTPRTMVSGGVRYGNPVVTPDGQFLLYTERLADGTAQVMRMPFTGGPATKLLSGEYRYQCASRTSNSCIVSQIESSNQLAFFRLDSLNGRGEDLLRVEVIEGSAYDWSLSSDGQAVAVADNRIGGRQIRIFDLHGGAQRMVVVNGLPQSVRWAPDGNHLYVSGSDKWISDQTPTKFGIFEVDLSGHVKVLLEMQPFQGRLSEPIPSPDGRYLIYTETTWPSNVTMLENF